MKREEMKLVSMQSRGNRIACINSFQPSKRISSSGKRVYYITRKELCWRNGFWGNHVEGISVNMNKHQAYRAAEQWLKGVD